MFRPSPVRFLRSTSFYFKMNERDLEDIENCEKDSESSFLEEAEETSIPITKQILRKLNSRNQNFNLKTQNGSTPKFPLKENAALGLYLIIHKYLYRNQLLCVLLCIKIAIIL